MHELTARGDRSLSRGMLSLFLSAIGERARSLRVSWKDLLFTGSIFAFAAAAIVVVNDAETVPSRSLAGRPTISETHPIATSRPSASGGGSSVGKTKVGATKTPLVGPIPESFFESQLESQKEGHANTTSSLDLSEVPDFVPYLWDGKVVGFIPKAQLFPASPPPSDQSSPVPTAADIEQLYEQSILTVYGPDLTTVVGHEYPGAGFVPLGEYPPPPSTPPGHAVTPPTLPPPGAG
jgi:hypothetical protein